MVRLLTSTEIATGCLSPGEIGEIIDEEKDRCLVTGTGGKQNHWYAKAELEKVCSSLAKLFPEPHPIFVRHSGSTQSASARQTATLSTLTL